MIGTSKQSLYPDSFSSKILSLPSKILSYHPQLLDHLSILQYFPLHQDSEELGYWLYPQQNIAHLQLIASSLHIPEDDLVLLKHVIIRD